MDPLFYISPGVARPEPRRPAEINLLPRPTLSLFRSPNAIEQLPPLAWPAVLFRPVHLPSLLTGFNTRTTRTRPQPSAVKWCRLPLLSLCYP